MRVLVCGGRNYSDWALLAGVLDGLHRVTPINCIIHGAARGADALAERWAIEKNVARYRFPADWQKYGLAAGPIRNQIMIDRGKPELLVAFPGGRGTADMIRRAQTASIRIVQVT